jgi:hypothetical protein
LKLLNENGFRHLRDIVRNTCFVLEKFLERIVNDSTELPKLAQVTENPSLLVDAKKCIELKQLKTKLQDFRLLLDVLESIQCNDNKERKRLVKTITKLYNKSDSGSGSGSDSDSGAKSESTCGTLVESSSISLLDSEKPSPEKINTGSQKGLCSGQRLKQLPPPPEVCPLPSFADLDFDPKISFSFNTACYQQIRWWNHHWPKAPNFEIFEFTECGVRSATTSYHVFTFTPISKTGYDAWFSTKYTYQSFSQENYQKIRNLTFWRKLSRIQEKHVFYMFEQLQIFSPPCFVWSIEQTLPRGDRMVVCFKKRLRDVSQPKDAFIQAWATPEDQGFPISPPPHTLPPPPPPSRLPPPPPPPPPPLLPLLSLSLSRTSPKCIPEPYNKRLPRLKGRDPTTVLVEHWTNKG